MPAVAPRPAPLPPAPSPGTVAPGPRQPDRAVPPEAPPGLPQALGLQPRGRAQPRRSRQPARERAAGLSDGEARAVNHQLTMMRDGEQIWWFLNTDPVGLHRVGSGAEMRRLVARLAWLGMATQSALATATGLSQSTVSRDLARLRREGERSVARPVPVAPRTSLKQPDVLKKAARMLEAGGSLNRVAKALEDKGHKVSPSTLQRYSEAGLLPKSQWSQGFGRSKGTADGEGGQPGVSDGEARVAGEDARRTGGDGPPEDDADGGQRTAEPVGQPGAGDAARVAVEPPAPRPPAPSEEQRRQLEAGATMGRATLDQQGRVAGSLGSLNGRQPRLQPASAVLRGGVLAALPALLHAGLLRHAALLELPRGFYDARAVLLLWAFLLLARVRNAERLARQPPGDWGGLLGLDRGPCPRTLRRRTAQLADAPGLPDWIARLSADWCREDPDTVATLFVDSHVLAYTGGGHLPKHFSPRNQAALPAAVQYWVNALGGAPLLCLHRGIDNGMVSEIFHGIVPAVRRLGLLPEDGRVPDQPALTLVFDRAGWSPELFRQLARRGIAVVTWIQGPQLERWPDEDFRAATVPLRTPGGFSAAQGRLAERPRPDPGPLEGGCRAREIRCWMTVRLRGTGQRGRPRRPRQLAGRPAPDHRQPALLTTHPSLPAETAIGQLRSRWSQENYFQYARQEFGLDTLSQHSLEDLDPDAWVVNPAWRSINRRLRSLRSREGTLRRQLAVPLPKQPTDKQRLEATERADELEGAERLQTLPAAQQQLLNTLRMLAYRAETAMLSIVAPHHDNPEAARVLLQSLFRTSASLRPDERAGTLTVTLMPQSNAARDRALAPLLETLNAAAAQYPGTNLRLVFESLHQAP